MMMRRRRRRRKMKTIILQEMTTQFSDLAEKTVNKIHTNGQAYHYTLKATKLSTSYLTLNRGSLTNF
jgi:hypothetical protein